MHVREPHYRKAIEMERRRYGTVGAGLQQLRDSARSRASRTRIDASTRSHGFQYFFTRDLLKPHKATKVLGSKAGCIGTKRSNAGVKGTHTQYLEAF